MKTQSETTEKLLFPARVSSQLASQTMSKRLLGEIIWRLDRDVWETFNHHRITVEPWAVGVRVYGEGIRGGIIGYKDLAGILQDEAENKSEQLPIQQRGKNLWFVGSSQGIHAGWHAVMRVGKNFSCDCMKYKCWQNRMADECPPLYKALQGRIFCHHTVAVALYENVDRLRIFG